MRITCGVNSLTKIIQEMILRNLLPNIAHLNLNGGCWMIMASLDWIKSVCRAV